MALLHPARLLDTLEYSCTCEKFKLASTVVPNEFLWKKKEKVGLRNNGILDLNFSHQYGIKA